jgi:FtsP/CotA-like multicopper oxidase with cupredoxin domain
LAALTASSAAGSMQTCIVGPTGNVANPVGIGAQLPTDTLRSSTGRFRVSTVVRRRGSLRLTGDPQRNTAKTDLVSFRESGYGQKQPNGNCDGSRRWGLAAQKQLNFVIYFFAILFFGNQMARHERFQDPILARFYSADLGTGVYISLVVERALTKFASNASAADKREYSRPSLARQEREARVTAGWLRVVGLYIEVARRTICSRAAVLIGAVCLCHVVLVTNTTAAVPGCELADTPAKVQQLINSQGLKDFSNPAELAAPPTSAANRLDLLVDYADIAVAGCPARLRTYNGRLVGPTIRAKPGDTLHLRLINKLPGPTGAPPQHPQQPDPGSHGGGHGHAFNFDLTNLHTHGLHVAPQGTIDQSGKAPFESDNVLIELGPGEQQDYRIEIPNDHPAGTFWYHAHVHGSTAMQLSSGMAGALIIEGGTAANGDLDSLPAIGKIKDSGKIFVLQQLRYDQDGKVETFASMNGIRRPTLINGQLVPVIRMRPGEVQRWRFIHAGVQENVALALDGHPLHEVATDGVSLGRSVPWAEAPASGAQSETTLFLAPGYRSDILIKARQPETGRRYFVRHLDLRPSFSLQAQERNLSRAPSITAESPPPVGPPDFEPGQILAELVIEGPEVTDQSLPPPGDLAGFKPTALPDITPAEIASTLAIDPTARQDVALQILLGVVCPADSECIKCSSPTQPGCLPRVFAVSNRPFSSSFARPLNLRTGGAWSAAEWTITAVNGIHPFHIHVNPFQLDRREPDGAGRFLNKSIWKDTILVSQNSLPPLRMRYTDFTGRFVLHCHILPHEDQGMMQMVEIK